ncbi:MAG: hypothetical protein NTY99_02825, partial [DPANN group archaeon]|nr:hypothetical protein [DPANN group archaeon]
MGIFFKTPEEKSKILQAEINAAKVQASPWPCTSRSSSFFLIYRNTAVRYLLCGSLLQATQIWT